MFYKVLCCNSKDNHCKADQRCFQQLHRYCAQRKHLNNTDNHIDKDHDLNLFQNLRSCFFHDSIFPFYQSLMLSFQRLLLSVPRLDDAAFCTSDLLTAMLKTAPYKHRLQMLKVRWLQNKQESVLRMLVLH